MGKLRTCKPQPPKPPLGAGINWANPITRGLQAFLPLNEGAGTPIEALLYRAPTTAQNYTWVASPAGKGLDFVSASSATVRIARASASFTNWSLACWFKVATSTTGTAYLLAWTNTADNSPIGALVHNVTGGVAGIISASWRNNTGFAPRVDTASAIYNDSTWHHAVGVFDQTSGYKIFIDGVNVSGTLTGTWPTTGTLTCDSLSLSAIARITTTYYTSSVDMPMAWDRLLSDAEAVSLYYNPGQMFLPAPGAWQFGTPGGAVTTTYFLWPGYSEEARDVLTY